MAQQGLAVAAVDYRLSGEARFPAQSHDVTAAVTWLREEPRFSLGTLPFVSFGASAGGLLAALAALDPALDLRASALWYAVSDIATMPTDQAAVGGPLDPPGESREELFIGGLVSDLPDLARAASPAHQVHADAPPFLLVHGGDDVLVPLHQSERLRDALAPVGVACELVVVEGYGHMFPAMPDDEVATHVDRTTQFLLTHAR
jgi:acetyl esterase/lipase